MMTNEAPRRIYPFFTTSGAVSHFSQDGSKFIIESTDYNDNRAIVNLWERQRVTLWDVGTCKEIRSCTSAELARSTAFVWEDEGRKPPYRLTMWTDFVSGSHVDIRHYTAGDFERMSPALKSRIKAREIAFPLVVTRDGLTGAGCVKAGGYRTPVRQVSSLSDEEDEEDEDDGEDGGSADYDEAIAFFDYKVYLWKTTKWISKLIKDEWELDAIFNEDEDEWGGEADEEDEEDEEDFTIPMVEIIVPKKKILCKIKNISQDPLDSPALAFSPTGKYLSIIIDSIDENEEPEEGEEEWIKTRNIWIYDVKSKEMIFKWDRKGESCTIQGSAGFSTDERWFGAILGGYIYLPDDVPFFYERKVPEGLRIFDIATGDAVTFIPGAISFAFSPDRSTVVVFFPLKVELYAISSWNPIRTLYQSRVAPIQGYVSLAFSPDGKYLALSKAMFSSSPNVPNKENNLIELWDVAKGELIAYLEGASPPSHIEISSRGILAAYDAPAMQSVLWRLP